MTKKQEKLKRDGYKAGLGGLPNEAPGILKTNREAWTEGYSEAANDPLIQKILTERDRVGDGVGSISVKARFGRWGGDGPEMSPPKNVVLLIQGADRQTSGKWADANITVEGIGWADYGLVHSYHGDGLFLSEDYYMEVVKK